jgi:glutathione S-transferase
MYNIYCQKVWLTLEEKRIPYRVEKINMRCYGEKPQSFMRLQPNGAIPVAIIDGTVYNQSNDIMYALEQTFPDHKKLVPPPNDEKLRIKANSLLRLERTLFSAWMSWLTGSDRSKGSFISILKEVENELSAMKGGDFFLGKDVTIVDFMFTPFLERTVASLLFFKGYQIRVAPGVDTEFKAINKWFDAMETLESYQLTKSDYYTHCWDLPPQLGGCTYEKGGERYEKVINGERTLDGSRGSWELPLEAHNCGVEPDWTWCGDEDAAKREAVERLSFNSANIAAFAARGAGKKGFPPYSAALSDPNATPSEGVKGSVDACLRVISAAMIGNDEDSANATMKEVATTILQDGGKDQVDDVVASLAYLRDRVGVPRDMRLPAARQLRARLNWAIEKMIS